MCVSVSLSVFGLGVNEYTCVRVHVHSIMWVYACVYLSVTAILCVCVCKVSLHLFPLPASDPSYVFLL